MEDGTPTIWVAAAIAAGAIGSGLTDLLLAGAGAAQIQGPLLGIFLAPALLFLALPGARTAVREHGPLFLVITGTAWALASLFDQHLTGAVVVNDPAGEVVHHGAGLLALSVGSSRFARATAAQMATPRR